jgi:hypothetical protein
MIIKDGIDSILSPSFREVTSTSQGAVIFWNLIVTFRLLGFPYIYLLRNN